MEPERSAVNAMISQGNPGGLEDAENCEDMESVSIHHRKRYMKKLVKRNHKIKQTFLTYP